MNNNDKNCLENLADTGYSHVGNFPLLKFIAGCLMCLMLVGCESDNEHFCARYQYVYDQLLEDDVPSYQEMRSQLLDNLNSPKKDQSQARFMLFVLEDWRSELKLAQESSRDFCMRIKRWQHYQ